ncbi:transcription initiation factor TFIID subunit A-domain-containing protein [Cristinia sonorae]|uniref:TBP-associated factor 12 n=1 Tax=Cristinia sonorae TaxID=1940300 RepID=A0A8K0V217_9AGAR|nr:transcription initiation factor TFIID subunit A-domain-containing protein [Cristinia sonorae]
MASNHPNPNAPHHPQHAQQPQQQQAAPTASIITALSTAFKAQNGDPLPGERIAQLLIQNMGQLSELAKQGKLNQQQIMQLKEYADKHKAGGSSSTAAAPAAPIQAAKPATANAAFKTANPSPLLSQNPATEGYPISQTINPTNPGPVQWPAAQQGRPTLTGGMPAGRISSTPAQVARNADDALSLEDTRVRRKNSPADQNMRRSIQDLVSSIDPNVKIEPEVEDLLLDIADEFIDSVTNFGCRLAKHRGGDTLEVRDLQLHLERNHNIRIPGFATDETRISLAQTTITPVQPAATSNKKGAQNNNQTLRSSRLAQVQQAKREAKLM